MTRNSRFPLYFILSVFLVTLLEGQTNTVGLVRGNALTDGYLLFAPLSHNSTYLIDREGMVVNQWTSNLIPGLTAYLTEDGTLFRAGRDTEVTYINGGGAGGIIEHLDWDGQLIWKYRYSSEMYRQHHDFKVLPNGHLLLLAWEKITKSQAIQAGRNPDLMVTDELWPDKLVEIAPTGTDGGEVVWEWRIWDHLIQDHDPGKDNFGVVEENPGRININYPANGIVDWIHGNSIVYDEQSDQIVLSTRAFNEVWIIDHSTTIAEAAGSTGGNAGKGGDLLYRWGNPAAYNAGTKNDQQLFGQHGLFLMESPEDEEPGIFIFNNGHGRQAHSFATVDLVIPELDDHGAYMRDDEGLYLPQAPSFSFVSADSAEMFAPLFSNVQILENGNMLMCIGPRGTFVEYDKNGQLIWKYISPVLENGDILNQGDVIGDQFSSSNSVFQVMHYDPDYPGLLDKDLTPRGPIEGPLVTSSFNLNNNNVKIFPNPASDFIMIESEDPIDNDVVIYSMQGVKMKVLPIADGKVNTDTIPAGVYLISLGDTNLYKIVVTN